MFFPRNWKSPHLLPPSSLPPLTDAFSPAQAPRDLWRHSKRNQRSPSQAPESPEDDFFIFFSISCFLWRGYVWLSSSVAFLWFLKASILTAAAVAAVILVQSLQEGPGLCDVPTDLQIFSSQNFKSQDDGKMLANFV